jgi:hypothetical protein
MEYQVPQFIEVEDKIFGPLTLKQFIYLAGGGGMAVMLVLYLHVVGFILAAPIVAFALALAFYKVNSRSFVDILESGFNYYVGGRLYFWKKDAAPQIKDAPIEPPAPGRQALALTPSRLHDLAFSLDIQDTVARQEEPK